MIYNVNDLQSAGTDVQLVVRISRTSRDILSSSGKQKDRWNFAVKKTFTSFGKSELFLTKNIYKRQQSVLCMRPRSHICIGFIFVRIGLFSFCSCLTNYFYTITRWLYNESFFI